MSGRMVRECLREEERERVCISNNKNDNNRNNSDKKSYNNKTYNNHNCNNYKNKDRNISV